MALGKVTQIIPATGWCAAYVFQSGSLVFHPLVAWALLEGGKIESDIIGIRGGDVLTNAEDMVGFYGYFHESTLDEVRESYSKFVQVRQEQD